MSTPPDERFYVFFSQRILLNIMYIILFLFARTAVDEIKKYDNDIENENKDRKNAIEIRENDNLEMLKLKRKWLDEMIELKTKSQKENDNISAEEIKKEKKQVANIEEHWGEIASSRECQLTDEDLQILKDFIKDL